MRVRRDFNRIYAEERDPWQIGDATDARYDAYRSLLLRRTSGRRTVLDGGCGQGAFLGRLRDEFEHLVGADVSARAVEVATARFSDAEFHVASIDRLDQTPLEGERFDAIVCSDVLYYLREEARRRALAWMAGHLTPSGVALVAAWCPGGNYLNVDELRNLVRRDFRIAEEIAFASGHVALALERKRRFVALTFDYETWQPIPEGKDIDWEADIFAPTDALLEACRAERARMTLFAEVGEYLWLRENDPAVAERMAAQWRAAVADGHEVGLHLHPSWLPELGAEHRDGRWWWDAAHAKADDYPGDLTTLVRRCVSAIEEAVRRVDQGYRVRTFRGGAYQAQPFRRLYEALVANGLDADSSVYAGGHSLERGYDYRLAWTDGLPYFASPCDPQLKGLPAEQGLVELPIRTYGAGERLMLDGTEAERFAARVVEDVDRRYRNHPTSEHLRRAAQGRMVLGLVYVRLRRLRRILNFLVPRRLLWLMSAHGPETVVGHEYHVAIGHTKGDFRVDALAEGIRTLRRDGRFELVTLAEAAAVARLELESAVRDPVAEAEFQVRREYAAVLGSERNEAQSHRLQAMIPLDRERVLDLGCGAGYWTARIADLYPWMRVVGVDTGSEFIGRAIDLYASARISFERGDFLALPFAEAEFDCVYADNTLEHAHDLDATLAEVARVLAPGGALVAAIPSDGRNPRCTVDNHTWKTVPHDVELRLRRAGFVNVEIMEVDVLRTLGQSPYPPSTDRMMYVRAWRRAAEATQSGRALEAMNWVYHRLDPSRPSTSSDAAVVIAGGYAYCAGYAVALGELLRREGIPVSWVTMEAAPHPRGRGKREADTHTVVAAVLEGREHVLDPMSNVCIPHGLLDVLGDPSLVPAHDAPDARWRERGYELYATTFWYERVRRYKRHGRLNPYLRLWRRGPSRGVPLSP